RHKYHFDDFEKNESDDENEASISDRTNIENSRSMNNLFQLFCIHQLTSVFPSLYTLLQIAVTLLVSNCSVERSFSKLKLVKTKLRSTMRKTDWKI
ncbi:zinc finger MYM-type protein 1-like, partial [Aphis craccivora]